MIARAHYLYAVVFVALAGYNFYRIFSNYDKKSSSKSHAAATNVLGRKNVTNAVANSVTIGNDKILNTGDLHDDLRGKEKVDDKSHPHTNYDSTTTEEASSNDLLRYSKGSQFLNNMDYVYNSTSSESKLLQKCLNLSLPLTNSDPSECWPLTYIMPSFPTSGSQLFNLLINNITYPLHTRMTQYKREGDGAPTYQLATDNTGKDGLIIHSRHNDSSLAFPLMKKAVLFKTHMGFGEKGKSKEHHVFSARDQHTLHGIVRIARNPGDHILRNKFRWTKNGKRCKSLNKSGDECFFKRAQPTCKQIFANDAGKAYVRFHNFWDRTDLNLPQIYVYYEHASQKATVHKAMSTMFRFFDFYSQTNYYMKTFYTEEKIEQLRSIVKEPEYEQGTLMARVCGKDIARKVHDITKEFSERLGYVFDNETATWSLEKPFTFNLTVG
ncbi:predicted protein [Chaetoceros tenuissimus]|uniref:Sulfotransferase domain-containing protein n=1 Tax=Chaetoceros tenuissimus TaxID=426638 RepID=A0AAD3CXA0_9STRA|nr:predicted protein [Chaetoceros tenuissimus]